MKPPSISTAYLLPAMAMLKKSLTPLTRSAAKRFPSRTNERGRFLSEFGDYASQCWGVNEAEPHFDRQRGDAESVLQRRVLSATHYLLLRFTLWPSDASPVGPCSHCEAPSAITPANAERTALPA